MHRGEVDWVLDDRRYPLRLTLGALAEIEAAYGEEGLTALGRRLSSGRLGAKDLVTLAGAALRGGGADLGDAELARLLPASAVPQLVETLGRLLSMTFGEVEPLARP